MGPFVPILIGLLIRLLEPFLKKLIEKAYREVEEWAEARRVSTGTKISSIEKMDRAIMKIKSARPSIEAAKARAYLEIEHLNAERRRRKAGKTARSR